jgi:hypothetical protein
MTLRSISRACCLFIALGLGALSATACDKAKEATETIAGGSSGGGNEGTYQHVTNANTGGTASLTPEQGLQRKMNLCRNYVMGESSKPADLNGVKKVCNEKKSPIPDKDPWGNELIYEPDPAGGNKFKIFSAGPDGKPGTPDDVHTDADKIK